ncbi:MAG: outer membrane protein transport protein [Planctomycetota bacterium]
MPVRLSVLLGLVLLGSPAWASGFLLSDHDAAGTARGFARTAGVDDAAALYWNPAAQSWLEDSEIRLGGHLLWTQGTYDAEPGQGFDDRMHDGLFALPSLFAAFDLSEHVDVGLAVFNPFALATHWNRNWSGRYQAIDSEVNFLFFQPTVSLKIPVIDVALSAGLQLNANVGRPNPVRLTNALDFRFLGQPDGYAEVVGHSESLNVGYVVSLSWRPTYLDERIVVGVTWRATPDDHEIEGKAKFQAPPAANLPSRAGAETEVTLPPYLTVGVQFELFEDLFWVELGYRWTGWSTLDRLVIQFDDPRVPTSITEFDYHDVNQYMLGLELHPIEGLALRAGYQFDETPTSSTRLSPRLPDADRHGLSFGFGVDVGPVTVDVAYMHLFIDTARKRNFEGFVSPGGNASANGDYDSAVDIFGASLSVRF